MPRASPAWACCRHRCGGPVRAHFAAQRRLLPLAHGELRANAWLLRPALDLLNIMLIVAVIAASHAVDRRLQVGLLYAFITYIGGWSSR